MSYKRSRANYESDIPSHQQPPFALFGTPLPPLDSDSRDDGSYVPVWKQEVRDERGRKRLHGAFTGGFSAGYFNTVGSKEGWTPATFVSSRTNRAKDGTAPAQKKAEDFMDDEDLADAAEAQKLETQGSFAGLGSTQEDGMRRGFMSDLFKTSGDTMGVKLLQRMGWREGQGVGPKVRRKARLDDDSNGKKGEAHLFAPENSRMVSFNRKSDRFGLGWAGEDRLGGQSTTRKTAAAQEDQEDEDDDAGQDPRNIIAFSRTTKWKPKAKPSGFGVGILNDTGSDEEDPYEMGPKISYNKIIGGDKKKRRGGIIANTLNSSTKGTAPPSFTSRKLGQRLNNAGFRKCHDGLLPLDGFVLASMPLLSDQENKHPPPTIPEGWVSSRSADTDSNNSSFKSTADAARASNLDPASRAAVLGENLLPGKSIFDYLSTTARDRLASATGRTNLPTARGESAPEGYTQTDSEKRKTLWDLVPRLSSTVAASALQRGTSGWMPYAEDLSKRARYRAFLELSNGTRDTLPERTPGTSLDDWSKELREFAQAAEVFKPISGLMASRFTSSSSAPKVASDSDPAAAAPSKREDPAESAAKFGMFGPMTRSRFQFYPTRLLCKRFNVKAPAHADPGSGPSAGGKGEEGAAAAAAASRLDVVSQAKLDQMMQEASRARPAQTSQAGAAEVVVEEARPEVSAVVPEVNEALEGERPGDAVFKAIFGSDSEDD